MTLLKRLWQYQWERFPVLVLLCTTTAVVVSSAGIVQVAYPEAPSQFFIAIVLSVLLLWNMRVLDEHRDYKHDVTFHADRPVQRGLISLPELQRVNVVGLVAYVAILFFVDDRIAWWGVLTLAYTFVVGFEWFGIGRLKKHFLLYNCINFVQMMWLQVLVYVTLDPTVVLTQTVLWVHFGFAITNAVLIEIVRKIKPPNTESAGNDTYSWRLGFSGALITLLVVTGLAMLLHAWCAVLVTGAVGWHAYFLVVASALMLLSCGYYFYNRTAAGEKQLQAVTILCYLLLHATLYFL